MNERMKNEKNSEKNKECDKKSGRPEKRVVEPIPDTPENVAKALFGIAPNGKKVKKRNGMSRC